MNGSIDYAEMLEIPVNTLNVTKKRGKKFWERSVRFAHGKNMLPDTGENGTMVTGTLTPIGTLYRKEEGRPHGRGL